MLLPPKSRGLKGNGGSLLETSGQLAKGQWTDAGRQKLKVSPHWDSEAMEMSDPMTQRFRGSLKLASQIWGNGWDWNVGVKVTLHSPRLNEFHVPLFFFTFSSWSLSILTSLLCYYFENSMAMFPMGKVGSEVKALWLVAVGKGAGVGDWTLGQVSLCLLRILRPFSFFVTSTVKWGQWSQPLTWPIRSANGRLKRDNRQRSGRM